MKVLIGVLEEQLENAIRLKEDYLKAIEKYGRGSVIKKRIYNQDYYYNEYRDGQRIVFDYLGKLKPDELKVLSENKHKRTEYKKMVEELDRQISFLKKALRLKEVRNV